MLTKAEVDRVLVGMTGTFRLRAALLSGTGMRLMEWVKKKARILPQCMCQVDHFIYLLRYES